MGVGVVTRRIGRLRDFVIMVVFVCSHSNPQAVLMATASSTSAMIRLS